MVVTDISRLGSFIARSLVVLNALLLAACAGADFNLPSLSDADISRAALTVSSHSGSLPTYDRTDTENMAMLGRVADRMNAAAPALCKHAEVDSCVFRISYSAEDTVNAYATEGGKVVIHRGLMEYLETEDEVAAVVGHEFGHHLAEHLEEKRDNAMIGAIIGGIVSGGLMAAAGSQGAYFDPSQSQQMMGDSMQLGAAVGALSYSKEQEREADLLSAYLLERAGYDLEEAGRVWVVLSELGDGDEKASLFDTHPAGPERVAAWEKTVADVEASPDKLPKWSN